MSTLSREELIQLVQQIMTVSGCVVDLDALLNRFESNVSYPNASELIFNPPAGNKLTAEQIVDLALQEQSPSKR